MPAAQKNMSIRLAVVDGKKVEDTFKRIGQTGEQAFERIDHSTKPATASLKAVDTTARALNSVFRQAAGLAGAYAGLSGLMRSIRSINETGMAFQGLSTALGAVTGSSKGAADEMAFLRAESERLGLNFLETSKSYLQIAAAAKGTTLAGQGTRDIFTALAEASTVLQLSVDQTNGALRAIGQIMSKGKVQTEELRGQLGERLYGAFQLAARGMGITTAELDKMLEQGKVVADDFLPKFAAEIRKTFSEGVPEASKNARAELNRFHNSVLEIERTVASSGFLEGLSIGYRQLAATLSNPAIQNAAQALGETLGSVVSTAAQSLSFLITHADLAVTALGGLMIARTVAGAVTALNATLVGRTGLAVGLKMAASVSTGFALRLVALEAASKVASVALMGLRGALTLVGGPLGLAVLAGIAILKLASGHDVAAKAAKDHAQELKEITQELGQTVKAVGDTAEALSKTESLYRFTKQLETAKDNIIALQYELKRGVIGGFWDQLARYGTPLAHDLYELRRELNAGKLSATEYAEALFKLATKHPNFGGQAEGVQQQVLALQAAERAAKKASTALEELQNPKPKQGAKAHEVSAKPSAPVFSEEDKKRIQDRIGELQAEEQTLRRLTSARAQGEGAVRRAMILNEQEQALRRAGLDITKNQGAAQSAYANQIRGLVASIHTLEEGEKKYHKHQQEVQKQEQKRAQTVKDVQRRYEELDKTLQGATARAEKWRNGAMLGLNQAAKGYGEFSAQVESVYKDMLKQARDKDLESSKRWEDGLKRGLKSVTEDAADMASHTETFITNAFKNMEDALVRFVQTGKMDFKSLADSIIADLIRIQIQSSITKPLAQVLNSAVEGYFGAPGGAGKSPGTGVGTSTPTAKAHTGGVIGGDNLSTKPVHPWVFQGASRFHRGGIVGNEVPIIAQKGEVIFTPGQMQLLGGALHSKPHVNVSIKVETQLLPAKAGRLDNACKAD